MSENSLYLGSQTEGFAVVIVSHLQNSGVLVFQCKTVRLEGNDYTTDVDGITTDEVGVTAIDYYGMPECQPYFM